MKKSTKYREDIRRYRTIAQALREQPGRWAVYPGKQKHPDMTRYMLEHANFSAEPSFPPQEFEFRVADGVVQVRCRIISE